MDGVGSGSLSDAQRPTTRYVSLGGSEMAHQVAGDGPLDLIFFTGIGSHLEFTRGSRTTEESAHLGQPFGHHAPPGPLTPSLANDETGFGQDAGVM